MDAKPACTEALTTVRTSPLVKGLAWLVLVLMAVATVYTAGSPP